VSDGIVTRKFPWWIYIVTLLVIVLVAASPVISVIIAGGIADANGCALDEGSIHTCMIGGTDWGGTLYALGVMGWFMLATLPLGGLALVAWLLVLIVHLIFHSRRKAQ
jgi:hypothetical protein